MSAPPRVLCGACRGVGSWFDHYCGTCGQALARLRWRVESTSSSSTPSSTTDWSHGSGRVAVRPHQRSVEIEVQNDGVVPAALVLRAQNAASLPSWVQCNTDEDDITIDPGKSTTIEIPLSPVNLDLMFNRAASAADVDRSALEASLTFLTTLTLDDGQGFVPRALVITLVIAREAWLQPACSRYLFVPIETLQTTGLEHRLELDNQSAETLEILDVSVVDDGDVPAGCVRVLAKTICALEPIAKGTRLASGKKRVDTLALRLPAGDVDAGSLGWFSFSVLYRFERGQVRGLVQGVVGRGPGLTYAGPAEWVVPEQKLAEPRELKLHNPGAIPVRVERIEVLRGDQLVSGTDWLQAGGVVDGDVIGPGSSRVLTLSIDPRLRGDDEVATDSGFCMRTLRIHHDGCGARTLSVQVSAQLGKEETPTGLHLGIDFGTSNSMVCLVRRDTVVMLQLETGSSRRQALPSVMYYRGPSSPSAVLGGPRGAGATADGDKINPATKFLYGDAADSSAEINPSNLVRSIKSVIARDASTQYDFLSRAPDGTFRREVFKSQQLLNSFIHELRVRAERAKDHLAPAQLKGLGYGSGRARFKAAVFSHPVEVTPGMRDALRESAWAAGLNRALVDPQDFSTQGCVDEATAAVLAYVHGRVHKRIAAATPPEDLERVLCFDLGGGTTDVAAIEIRGQAAFLAQQATRIELVLCGTAGDNRFGGDDLDALIARAILDDIGQASTRQGAPILKDEIQFATECRSFSEFHAGFRARERAGGDVDNEGADERALAVYNKAVELLRRAEAAKRRLSEEQEVELVFSGTGWPRRAPLAGPTTENFEVKITRARFEQVTRAAVAARARLLNDVVTGADWSWSSLDTLLFTGQGVLVPCIREVILEHINAMRGPGAPPLLVVQPGDSEHFHPKGCVALGAALWGMTQEEDGWIQVTNRMQSALTFDVQTKVGPTYPAVRGLTRGTPLPAVATVPFAKSSTSLTLYKNGQAHVEFTFPPAREVSVRVLGPADFRVIAGTTEVRGEMQQ
ncbi:MAG: Hsp70 family protein [Deltaproteobacteria bacterium]|nr:Hsp70 family protein [Deltaproteobacteria bacterium]